MAPIRKRSKPRPRARVDPFSERIINFRGRRLYRFLGAAPKRKASAIKLARGLRSRGFIVRILRTTGLFGIGRGFEFTLYINKDMPGGAARRLVADLKAEGERERERPK